jgi:hypothetical protein
MYLFAKINGENLLLLDGLGGIPFSLEESLHLLAAAIVV